MALGKSAPFVAHLSQRLTWCTYSTSMIRRPSVHRRSSVIHTYELANWPIFIKFYMKHHWGWEKQHKVLGQIGSKLWFPWQQKTSITYNGENDVSTTYNGENDVSTFSLLFFYQSFSNLRVTRTGIISQVSSNFSQIRPLPTELEALEHLKDFT